MMRRQATPNALSFAKVAGTDSYTITSIHPPLILKSRNAGILTVEQIAFRQDSPLILVMPSLNGVDCSGAFFRVDMHKGVAIGKTPTAINPNARKVICDFCKTAVSAASNYIKGVSTEEIKVTHTTELAL